MSKIEKSFFVHFIVLVIFVAILILNFKIDINEYIDQFVYGFENYMTDALNENVKLLEEGVNRGEYTTEMLDEYKITNMDIIRKSAYTLYYYFPAFIILILVLIVNVENVIFEYFKMRQLKLKSQREYIKYKINKKYNRITLAKKIPIMFIGISIVTLLLPKEQEIITRTLQNLIFALAYIITVYGIILVIKIFKTQNPISKAIYILLNILFVFILPQFYFAIGFIESMLNVRIIIKKKME